MRALRLTLLDLIARVLRRWLNAVTARLETAAAREAPAPPRVPADPRQPAPPDHWVELVQQYAPQLLEVDGSNVLDGSGVIDYRADEFVPAPRPSITPTRSAPKPRRPMRLEPVAVPAPEPHPLASHGEEAGAESLVPPSVTTTIRPLEVTVPPLADTPPDAPLFRSPQHPTFAAQSATTTQTGLPVSSPGHTRPPVLSPAAAQPISEARTAYRSAERPHSTPPVPPIGAAVPVVRTRAETGWTGRPMQTILRPTTMTPLSSESFSADHWPSLPDQPAEEAPDRAKERQHHERLKSQQEGRAWNE